MSMKKSLKFLLFVLIIIAGPIVRGQLALNGLFPAIAQKAVSLNHTVNTIRLPSGIRLEYAEQGSRTGVPVIFLHGYTDSWQSFNQVLSLLPESIHAYSISQRGHGGSDRPEKGYAPENFADDVFDFMQELNINSAIIVGHSMGATVAQRFALDYKYMTRALILVGSFASFTTNPGIAELQQFISKIEDPLDRGFVFEFQKSTLFKPLDSSILKTYVDESMKVPARVWKTVAIGSMTVDYSKALTELSAPTLIIWGDKDVFCPKADQYILTKAIKRSSLLIYEGVGHAVQWEDPKRFTNDILDFINRNK